MFNYLINTMMRFNTCRSETDFVYNFYKIATVVLESENNATVRLRNEAPIASSAIYTTFSSLKVMCYAESLVGHNPETNYDY